MENSTAPTHTCPEQTQVQLRLLLNKLMDGLIPFAVSRKSFFVNQVTDDVYISTDRDTLAFLLGSMMNSIVATSESECIRIDAYKEAEKTVIQLKDHGHYYYSGVSSRLKEMLPAARKLGADISVNSQDINGTTFTLLFKDCKAA